MIKMLIISLSNKHINNTNQPSYGGWLANEISLQTDQHASKLTQCYNLHVMILSSVNNIRICYSKQTIETIRIPNLKQQIWLITFIFYLAAMVWLCVG